MEEMVLLGSMTVIFIYKRSKLLSVNIGSLPNWKEKLSFKCLEKSNTYLGSKEWILMTHPEQAQFRKTCQRMVRKKCRT